MTTQPPKKVRVLTRLKISEVSAVDRGAGEGVKVLLMKRADDSADPPPLTNAEKARAMLEGRMALRHAEEQAKREQDESDDRSGPLFDKFHKIFRKKSYAVDEADDKDEETPAAELDGHVISPAKKHRPITFDNPDGTRMKFPNERALAEWIAIQHRVHKSNSTEESTTMSLDLSAVVKAHGIGALCRHMIKSATSFGVDEHQLVKLATEDAERKYPTDTPAIAFSKLYTESSELRDAIEIAKGVALQNDVADALAQDGEAACAELTAIGKARWPSLSPAQRFARAFETNPTLAARAHRRPGPSTSFPHPVAKAKADLVASLYDPKPTTSTETNVDDPAEALAQLRALGRQRWPSKSEAESFLLAITDAENADLVNRALATPKGSSPARQ